MPIQVLVTPAASFSKILELDQEHSGLISNYIYNNSTELSNYRIDGDSNIISSYEASNMLEEKEENTKTVNAPYSV